jgi:hypothetical protein
VTLKEGTQGKDSKKKLYKTLKAEAQRGGLTLLFELILCIIFVEGI